jgi:tRNA dimethylallyltransferase
MHSDELFALLLTLDQRRAASIDRKNPVRLIRAIEIATALGSVPILPPPTSTFDTLTIGINIAPEVLRQRIHARLLSRMRRGMLAEARKLHTSGVSWKRMEALGLEYRAMARHLKGAITKEDMLHELEHDSVHYAKRQMTWFRRDHTIHWIEHGDTAQAIARACSFFGAQTTPG